MRILSFFFLAFFISSSAHATTYYWYPEPFPSNQYSTAQAACDYWVQRGGPYTGGNARTQASYYYNAGAWYCRFQIASNPTGYTSLGYIYLGGNSCDANKVLIATAGGCFATCPVAGQTQDSGTGACACPSGQFVDTGTFHDIIVGNQAACRTPANRCTLRSGQVELTYDPAASFDGCAVTCVVNPNSATAGSAFDMFAYKCTYTGGVAGGGNDPNINKPSTEQAIAGVPSAAPPAFSYDPGTNGAPPGGCNAGDAYGTINGVSKCVPQTKPDGTPNQNTAPNNASTQTTVTNTSTQTNSDGSTTTVSTTTTSTTGTSGSGSSTGGSTGNGSGNGNGAGECDPTAKDYLNCMAGDQTPVEHTHGNAENFGDAMNNFQDGLRQTPIGGLASASGIGGSVNVGACPIATFDLFGHSVVMNAHCAIYDSVGPTLTTIMHVFYVVIGILIILSA